MKVAILGFGTVGRGVYNMIQQCSALECDCVLERPGLFTESFIVNDIGTIISDDSIEAVVECIGGTGIAHDFAVRCLEAGKHFVTSNKALVSAYGPELQELALRSGAAFLFSAACGGSMPILLNLSIAVQSDRIIRAGGILNGTCNYILTRMQEEGRSYEQALKEAQELGYAESDPTADVSGLDTLRKVNLLSAVAFGCFYNEENLPCEGIENVNAHVVEVLREKGLVLRLLGSCGIGADGGLYAFVQPVAFGKGAAEANVRMNLNLAFWEGENCGRMTLSGQGAGRYPTAANVLRDLTEIAGGRRRMLAQGCRRESICSTDGCLFRYIVVQDDDVLVTQPVPVADMHRRAAELRKAGSKVFFAALDQS